MSSLQNQSVQVSINTFSAIIKIKYLYHSSFDDLAIEKKKNPNKKWINKNLQAASKKEASGDFLIII